MRTPLASLQMLLDHLLNKADLNNTDFVISSLKHMQVSANETYQLLDNLLAWSRNQLHSLKCKPVYFDLKQVIANNVKLLENTAMKKSIDINFQNRGEILAYADEEMIKSVVRNLLLNALKFSFKNGKIIISIKKSDQELQVVIEDFGQGMSKDFANAVFDENYHSTPGTQGEKGTGLGLGLCKKFVTMNNGNIWVESEIDKGSRFCFTLPSKKP